MNHPAQTSAYCSRRLALRTARYAHGQFWQYDGVTTFCTADTILPYLLNQVTRIYPKLSVDVCVKRGPQMVEMLNNGEVDLAISTQSDHYAFAHPAVTLRTSLTLWYCAADYRFMSGEVVPLVVLDAPSPFRTLAVESLDTAGVPWRIAYIAPTLAAVRSAVKAGMGITLRPVEMMSPDLRVLGGSEGLPELPARATSCVKILTVKTSWHWRFSMPCSRTAIPICPNPRRRWKGKAFH